MLQNVAHVAGIRNGYSGWNGRASPADAGPIPTPSCCSRQRLGRNSPPYFTIEPLAPIRR
jgi:hypothetical protein